MKFQNILIMLVILVLCSFSATATTWYNQSNTCTGTGTWNNTNNYTNACDNNWGTYAKCDGDDCVVDFNFTGISSIGYYDSIVLSTNFSSDNTTNTEDILTGNPACVLASSVNIRYTLNNSDGDNVSMSCYNGTDYEFIDDDSWNPSWIWDSQLVLTDETPTMTSTYVLINNSEKECSDDRCFDLIFTVTDNTEVEYDCFVYIDGVRQDDSENSSIQNNTVSVISDCLESGGSHEVYARCYDEHGYVNGETIILIGEECESCETDFMDYMLIMGVIFGFLIFLGASYFKGGAEFFKTWWWLIMILFVAMLILWYIKCWLLFRYL